MNHIIILLIGYFIGSISSSYLIGKLSGNIDIRQHGSGNLGATNAFRVLGLKAGVGVFVADLLKGVVAALIGMWIAGDIGGLVGGLAAVLGHNWPVFLGFRGGKGVATSMGLIFTLFPWIGLILVAVGFIVILVSRYVSLASLIGSFLFPVLVAVFGYDQLYVIISIILAGLAIFRHKSNIMRLAQGKENKISFSLGRKNFDKG